MTLESTPAQKKAFSTFYAGQKDGTGKPPSDAPDGGPRASKLHRGMSDLLAGKPAATDTLTPGDQTDTPANDAASIEEEARSRLDADALAGVDEGNPWAIRLLKATIKLVEIERARPAGV